MTITSDTPTVKIDPCSRLAKGLRKLDDVAPSLCLPSPLQSLLSPRRLLHMLSEGPQPYVCMQEDQVDETGEEAGLERNGTFLALPNNTDSKMAYPVVAHESEVVFLDLDAGGDPRYTQGSRDAVEHLHICPEEVTGCPDNQGPVTVQHTPTTQLLRKSSLAHFAVTSMSSSCKLHDLLCCVILQMYLNC